MSKGLHVAIIMDGNGRWAQARGWPRTAGHRAGADSVRRIVEAAPSIGIGTLTLYAFSADNWKRPTSEVRTLFSLLASFLRRETARCVENGVRFSAIGRRDRLPAPVVGLIEQTERATAACDRLDLRVALDYSSREALLRAVQSGCRTQEQLDAALGPPVDLLIRTSGEQRLSDFLLWECAYAELLFTPVMWPDFSASHLSAAVDEFYRRQRRFGAVQAAPARSALR
jgi:undecaprenyl diphosphate synthase